MDRIYIFSLYGYVVECLQKKQGVIVKKDKMGNDRRFLCLEENLSINFISEIVDADRGDYLDITDLDDILLVKKEDF